jgi:hypothetical protein
MPSGDIGPDFLKFHFAFMFGPPRASGKSLLSLYAPRILISSTSGFHSLASPPSLDGPRTPCATLAGLRFERDQGNGTTTHLDKLKLLGPTPRTVAQPSGSRRFAQVAQSRLGERGRCQQPAQNRVTHVRPCFAKDSTTEFQLPGRRSI